MEVTDNQLRQMSDSIDSWILEFCHTNKIPAFMLTSIVIARLAVMCRSLDMSEDFKRLLAHSIETVTLAETGKHDTIH